MRQIWNLNALNWTDVLETLKLCRFVQGVFNESSWIVLKLKSKCLGFWVADVFGLLSTHTLEHLLMYENIFFFYSLKKSQDKD